MEWKYCCWSVNTMTPFLFESTGDSEEIKSDVHHHHHHEEDAVMDESEGISFRFDDEGDVDIDDVDDDAQSSSYDHSSYINTRYDDSQHDLSQRIIYDDDDDDDDENKNWGESKLVDSSKKQKRSHKFCVDSNLDQREIDRKFWEACLAT